MQRQGQISPPSQTTTYPWLLIKNAITIRHGTLKNCRSIIKKKSPGTVCKPIRPRSRKIKLFTLFIVDVFFLSLQWKLKSAYRFFAKSTEEAKEKPSEEKRERRVIALVCKRTLKIEVSGEGKLFCQPMRTINQKLTWMTLFIHPNNPFSTLINPSESDVRNVKDGGVTA